VNFKQIVYKIITETLVASGANSVFGGGVQSTESPFSGDNYATGDARRPSSLFGGVLTRFGKIRKKTKKKRSKKKTSE
jgi:hypothetical protein